jgi:hypothetical protein
MITLFPSGFDQHHRRRCARDCKVYFQKFNVGHRLRGMRALCDPAAHRMDLRQYSVLGQAHGCCGWYS